MDLSGLMIAIVRRWYLSLAVLGLTIGLCFGVWNAVSPSYETKAYVLIMPPVSRDMPQNRLLSLGSLSQAKDVLIQELDADEMHQVIADQGLAEKYTVAPDFTSAAPVIVISATSDTFEESRLLADELLSQAGRQMTSLQKELSIQPKDQITSVVLSRGIPKPVGKARTRALIAAAGLGLGVGVLLIGLLDGYLLRRRARASTATPVEDPESATQDRDSRSQTSRHVEAPESSVAMSAEIKPLDHARKRVLRRRPRMTSSGRSRKR